MKLAQMRRALDTPWKLSNEANRLLVYPIVRTMFALNSVPWGRAWRIYGIPILQKHRHSTMRFGAALGLRSSVWSNPLGPNHPVILTTWAPDAVLDIGDHFGMTGGTVCAAESIVIGNNVFIGANSTIIDTDFHPLYPEERRLNPSQARTAPVRIGDDVFIGMNCVILKGVTIGRGSVIGAGSIVARDIPSDVVVAGNPAIVVRPL